MPVRYTTLKIPRNLHENRRENDENSSKGAKCAEFKSTAPISNFAYFSQFFCKTFRSFSDFCKIFLFFSQISAKIMIFSQKLTSWVFNDQPCECAVVGQSRTTSRAAKIGWEKKDRESDCLFPLSKIAHLSILLKGNG